MHIEQALPAEAAAVAAVLNEAAQWLATGGRPLWSATDVGLERVQGDTDAGRYFIARENGDVAGVVRIDMEDAFFWPEIEPGSSAFVHKLAVRRSWGGKGVSTALLAFARERTRSLGRPYLLLDCVADRQALRTLYEGFGFVLHSVIQKGTRSFARYELRIDG
ncbi:GNAT superfamily N-acetyltransferase [Variovorax boronicumulans]|uniref:GNAT family N-acetyltransferase n=1 Tax=Variovorax boronicumulans TaxID=436515 RepID=UPI0024757A89|nr:GNAT family N-acetyltransferase [Variovorax boronicumulans]MDH6165825.1 GNAT superfamily N-acetyltransferase [Variovorax boronicumulans]